VTALYVALGAALGAPLRFAVGHVLDGRAPGRLPWGTVLVNLLGSFLLGVFSGWGLSGHAMALLGTGFCGAFTTYSAFAVQTHTLTHSLGARRGLLNVLLTVPLGLALCALGFVLAT